MNYSFENTILVLTDNDKLVKKLENIASSFGIQLFLADPNKPDIFAVPYFIALVDKKYFPKEDKEKYADVLDKSEIFYTDEFEINEILNLIKNKIMKNYNNREKVIEQIFNLLSKWRKLPDYQLERRADIYFAIHLSKIFKNLFSDEIIEIIPEFPIRKGTVSPETNSNRSFKIDYAVFTKTKRIYLVELKTDNESIRQKQIDEYLKTLEHKPEEIFDGIKKINKATKTKITKEKYKTLIKILIELNALSSGKESFEPTHEYKFHSKPIFIVPDKDKIKDYNRLEVIDFEQIIKCLDREKNVVTREFVKALRQWKN